ncbi:hypothetical protein JKP88DRAFT_298840 [Tribonema minus]|uniref:Saccharopine dehydrogenase NADP binding domain-containing protein n=1 Tax=Tribonema minus TaxID=303371 RepID=A0A836CMB4_9STRA|nr:hypothetical protein JKP88DRAFT_298840 [Tribonema minus]
MAPLPVGSRPHHILVWGATGFTGRLIVEYLHANYPLDADGGSAAQPPLRWALAGRNEERLRAVKRDLGLPPGLPHLIADSHDEASLEAMSGQADVVITTVGPYLKYGTILVEACARAGTHLCDLTGESLWVEEIIEKFDKVAQSTGAKIVPSCGFDSIPADMGTFMIADHLKRVHNTETVEVTYHPGKFSSGAPSGGTVASLMGIVEAAWEGGAKVRNQLNDPYLLVPSDQRPTYSNPSTGGGFGYDAAARGWTAPFVFAGHDSKIVHRSNALLHYGPLRYRECMLFGGRVLGLVPALCVAAALNVAAALLFLPPTRALLRRALPKAGDGPTQEQRDSGFFWVNLEGKGADGTRVAGVVGSDHGDCGYKETAKMLSECAVTLALDGARLPARGGVLTTASAMGAPLLERLRARGMTFTVETVAPGGGSGAAAASADGSKKEL